VSGDKTTKYLLDVDGIDDGSTYAIVSTVPTSARILYNESASSTTTDKVRAGTISPSTMDETTTLTLNSNREYTEAQQTWVAEASGSGFTLRGVASNKYLDLSTVTTSETGVNLSSTSGEGTVLTISGTNAKTVSYATNGRYTSTTIYGELTEEQCTQTAYYYLNDSGVYERVTKVERDFRRGRYYWYIYTTEATTEEESYEGLSRGSSLSDLYIYDASPVSNYLIYSSSWWASGNFCTSTSTSGNTVYFFKKVTGYFYGYANTDYLDAFITHAEGLNGSDYDADDWAYMQDKLQEAKNVKSTINTSVVDIATARKDQNKVNTAAANLQYALLLLDASRYFVAFDENSGEWVAVASDSTGDADLATMDPSTTSIEEAGNVQMVTSTTQGVGLPTYMPLTVPEKEAGQTTWTFEADSANTGYISSANTAGDYQAYSGDIRVAYWYMTDLEASFKNSSGRSTLVNSTYTPGRTKMQVLTHSYLSGSDVLNRISDSYNSGAGTSGDIANYAMKTTSALGLEKYDEARDNFETTLKEGGSQIFGLHFMDAVISKDATFVAEQATINGVTYSNYEMPEACIDFTLQQRSYITFFAGTYYLNSGHENNSFFSLYQIERKSAEDNSGSAIKSIKEISLIYGNTNDATLPYVYQYSDGSYSDGNTGVPSDYTLLFDTSWIKDPTIVEKAMYYYEIPVNKGEYALGSVGDPGQTSSNKYGAYLMYLDISANKQEVRQQEITELITDTTSTYVYPKGVQLVASGNTYTSDTDSVAASISAESSTSVNAYLLRNSDTDTVSAVNCTNAVFVGEGLKVQDASGTSLDVKPTSKTEKKAYSITDYAYNVTEDVWHILQKETTQETDANGRVNTTKKYLVDGEDGELPDGETIPDIPTTSETAITYHYTLPTGATVTTTNTLTGLNAATGFYDKLTINDYPAIGADPIDMSSLVKSYDVNVTTTSELDLYLDQIKTGYTVVVNGDSFTISSPTKKKTIQP
jgi:hypothetical protein